MQVCLIIYISLVILLLHHFLRESFFLEKLDFVHRWVNKAGTCVFVFFELAYLDSKYVCM